VNQEISRLAFAFELVLGFVVASQGQPASPKPVQQPIITYETLQERARALAAKPFHPDPAPELPEALKKLNYDTYNAIRFRAQEGPWASNGLQFGVQLFHRGYLYQDAVRIHLLKTNQVKDFPFSPRQFDYGTNQYNKNLTQDLQFAGLRILYSPTQGAKKDEVTAFLGASYFRPVGLHQRYGGSARAVAVDTAEPSGEEFPRFTEFWLEQPTAAAKSIELYALLDGPSLAGAGRFVIRPGEMTKVEVDLNFFMRKEVKKIGLAPLTSMFWFGKERTRFIPDFRPEVHDSDGLLIAGEAGQWFWRPLLNPPRAHHVSHFPVAGLRGFGLMQRERNFCGYEDLAARYELRPSLWVEPSRLWPGGVIELVEIPTSSEYNDNIVSYWLPPQKAAAGQQFHITYNLSALRTEPTPANLLRVASTRLNPERDKVPPRFIVDFSGECASSSTDPINADVQTSKGELRNVVTQTNEATGGWRVFFDLAGITSDPAELRLSLKTKNQTISETWVYHYQKP
jgi:glucans biosynthesis protein